MAKQKEPRRSSSGMAGLQPPRQRFIVGEISKAWILGRSASPLLREQFEEMIAGNLRRGYALHSFSLSQVMSDAQMNETIIAVFKEMDQGA